MMTSEQPVVLKFGGTSVRDAEAMRRVVAITLAERASRTVVVTSACAGVTDRLLECARLAGEGDGAAARDIVAELERLHYAIHDELSLPDALSCRADLREMLSEISRLVDGVILLRELTPRSTDAFASFGERLSSVLLAAAFRGAGAQAALSDSRRFIITDECFSNARPLMDEIDRRAMPEIAPLFDENDVVVLQGFIGSTREGVTTTIGRGGSDHSAALVGAAIGAREIQIWTDVSGILSADPRVVPDARVVPEVSFTEARELAYFGAKVLHPDTILPAVARGIPVSIRNSMAPRDPGTRILPDGLPLPAGIHSVTVRTGMMMVEMAARRAGAVSGAEEALPLFAEFDAPLHCSLTVESRGIAVVESAAFHDVLRSSIESRVEHTALDGIAVLALIGAGLRGSTVALAGALGALGKIPVRFVIAGSSDHVAVVGLDESVAAEALRRVHGAIGAPHREIETR